ncbi:MAG: hypothetical protein ABIJ10_06155 [Candidatus Micrarchaeota archaeon]
MELDEMKYAELVEISKGYILDLVCENGTIARITAGRRITPVETPAPQQAYVYGKVGLFPIYG